MNGFITFLLLISAAGADSLQSYSAEINKGLPETYDHATKLMRTRVENNDLNFDFIVGASKEEFASAFPKVRSQVMSTVCRQKREGTALRQYRANVIYRYESAKGESLGEFMVRPDHCGK